jgi:hypothetical protein
MNQSIAVLLLTLLESPFSVHEAHLKHAEIFFSDKNTTIVLNVIQIQNRPVWTCPKCHLIHWHETFEIVILERR